MISLLSRLLIKNHKDYENPQVRQSYGMLCGLVGICLNILLFAGKYSAGTLSGSIAIVADSFNNLSDAGSSLVTLLGFRLAGKKPDPAGSPPRSSSRRSASRSTCSSITAPWAGRSARLQ